MPQPRFKKLSDVIWTTGTSLWLACLKSLSTERRNRARAEREAQEERQKRIELLKREKNKNKKGLQFAHRRNGGGKRRSAQVQEGSDESKRLKQNVIDRRNARRRAKKALKRSGEQQKPVATPVIVAEAEPVEEELIVSDIEELTEQELAEKEAIEAQEQLVIQKKTQDLAVKDAFESFIKLRVNKLQFDALERAPKVSKVIRIVRVLPLRPRPVVKKPNQLLELIQITTPLHKRRMEKEAAMARMIDRKGMASSLRKTKMCRSVLQGHRCKYGTTCRFAHSEEELCIAKCFFGDSCKTKHKCPFMHPGETKAECLKRTQSRKTHNHSSHNHSHNHSHNEHKTHNHSHNQHKHKTEHKTHNHSHNQHKHKTEHKTEHKTCEHEHKTEHKTCEHEHKTCEHEHKTCEQHSTHSHKTHERPMRRGDIIEKFQTQETIRRSMRERPVRAPPPKTYPDRKPICRSVGSRRPCQYGRRCKFQHVSERTIKGVTTFFVPKEMRSQIHDYIQKHNLRVKNIPIVDRTRWVHFKIVYMFVSPTNISKT